MTDDVHKTKWGNRFIITAIIQGGIMTSLALTMVASQFVFAINFDMIQFLSLSFEGPAKWFFLGIVFYLIFIVAIAVTAIFYIHLEINLRRQISGLLNVLAWIHLIGMNIGGPLTTLLMIFAGLSGSGVLSVFTEGKISPQNIDVLNALTTPIALSIGILSIGVICGGLAYVLTYFKEKRN
ncbi:MAG: hypothetical protein DA329_07765 [Candidatus Nitrosocosmicus sp.]|jgi:hypothetical protein|nr:hypothetical protein [Candidatus Nitrosocosmicus sp.]